MSVASESAEHAVPRLWHPRYWPSWVAVALVWSLGRLPFPLIWALGQGVSLTTWQGSVGRSGG